MKKIRKFLLAVLGAAVFVGACSKAEEIKEPVNKEEKKQEEDRGPNSKLDMLNPAAYANVNGLHLEPGSYISIIGKRADGEYWNAVQAGAEKAAEDINEALDYEGADKVKVVYNGPAAAGDVDDQVNILDEELARYPDALAIAVIDSQSCGVQFDLAAENNIPIVAFDSESNYQGVMANVITDNGEAARAVAGHMAEAMKESGEVILLVHDSKSITSGKRAEEFVKTMQAQYPGIVVGNSYYLDKMDEMKKALAEEKKALDPSKEILPETITEEEVLDDILEKNPGAQGIYATDGSSVMKAVDTCGRLKKGNMVIMGFDADTKELSALEDGDVAGLVAQNPYGMGYGAVVAAARSILKMGNEAVVNSGFTWITEENMEEQAVKNIMYQLK